MQGSLAEVMCRFPCQLLFRVDISLAPCHHLDLSLCWCNSSEHGPPNNFFFLQAYLLNLHFVEDPQKWLVIRADQELFTPLGVLPGLVQDTFYPKMLSPNGIIVGLSGAVE